MRKTKPFALIIMIMVLVVTTLTTNVVSAATLERFETLFIGKIPIQQAPNVVIIDTNTEIPSDYQFIMKITEKTNVRLFGTIKGAKTYKTNLNAYPAETLGNPDNVITAIPLEKNAAGSYGVIYENVGVYKGKAIDVKMTIVDYTQWIKADNPYQPHVYINSKHMGINVGGADIRVRYEFKEHDTGKAIDVKGVFSMADIDSFQGLEVFNSPSNPQKIYVPSTSNLKYSKTPNGFGLFSDRFEKDVFVDSENPNHIGLITFNSNAIELKFYQDREPDTYTPPLRAIKEFTHNGESYKQGSKFEWREIENWKKANPTLKSEEYFIHEEVGYSDINIGASYFEVSPYKPVRTAIEAPRKTVSDLDETEVQENTLTNADETFTYKISHFVPAEYAGQVYKSYVFTDDLEDVLEVQNIHIKNEFGTDVTNYFDLVKDDATSKITATALASVLQQDNLPITTFYNHVYTFEIDVKIKDDADLDIYKQDDNATAIISNKASVIVDGVDYKSNTVQTVTPTYEKIATQVKKSIVDGNQLVEKKDVKSKNEIIKYQIDYTLSDNKKITTLTLKDDLEDVLDLSAVKVKAEGQDIMKLGNLHVNHDTEEFKWVMNKEEIKNYYGKTITVEVESKFKATANFDNYVTADKTAIEVPNVAQIVINDETPINSNKVHVVPKYEDISSQVQKYIVDNGKLLGNKKIEALKGNIDYRIDYTIPDNKELTSLILIDDLENVLDVQKVTVVSNETDITNLGILNIDQNTEEVIWVMNKQEIENYYGKTITLLIAASMKENVSLNDYLLADGMTVKIPNVGQMQMNNETPIASNPVNLELISKSELEVRKYIENNGKLVEKKEMQVLQGDVNYRIDYTIPFSEGVTSILLEDDLEDVLDVKDAMVTIANEEITHYGELHIDHEKEEVVWKINNEKIKEVMGKIISLKVKTTIKDDADLASYLSTDGMTTEIPNIGEISLNNEKPVKSNEVIIASKIDNPETTPTTPTTTGDKPANVVVTETTPTQTTVTETVEAKVLPQTSESTNWWVYVGLALIIGTLGWLYISKRKTI